MTSISYLLQSNYIYTLRKKDLCYYSFKGIKHQVMQLMKAKKMNTLVYAKEIPKQQTSTVINLCVI